MNYPESLPLKEGQLVMEILRSRKIAERKKEFAKAEWVVQGYVQKVLIGEPDALAGLRFAEDDTEFIDNLYNALEEANESRTSFTAENEAETGNIFVVLSAVSVLLQLVRLIRERRNPS